MVISIIRLFSISYTDQTSIAYGYKYNQTVFNKLYWFGQYSYLMQIAKYYENNDLENVNREIYALRNFRSKYGRGQ